MKKVISLVLLVSSLMGSALFAGAGNPVAEEEALAGPVAAGSGGASASGARAVASASESDSDSDDGNPAADLSVTTFLQSVQSIVNGQIAYFAYLELQSLGEDDSDRIGVLANSLIGASAAMAIVANDRKGLKDIAVAEETMYNRAAGNPGFYSDPSDRATKQWVDSQKEISTRVLEELTSRTFTSAYARIQQMLTLLREKGNGNSNWRKIFQPKGRDPELKFFEGSGTSQLLRMICAKHDALQAYVISLMYDDAYIRSLVSQIEGAGGVFVPFERGSGDEVALVDEMVGFCLILNKEFLKKCFKHKFESDQRSRAASGGESKE